MERHRPHHLFKKNSAYFITGRTYGQLPHFAKDGARLTFRKTLFEKMEKFTLHLYAWVVTDNHYHVLFDNADEPIMAELEKGVAGFSPRQEERRLKPANPKTQITKFIQELHGATSYKIKKLPKAKVFNQEQIAYRQQTPMEARIENRLDKIVRQWERAVNRATPKGVAGFSPRQPGLAKFTSRLSSDQREEITQIIKRGDLELAKVLLAIALPQYFNIPFWYQYSDHIIEDRKSFFTHFNYIHQNCVKHGLTDKVTDYEFSSYNYWLEEKGQEWMRDALAEYPVVDFGGKWLE